MIYRVEIHWPNEETDTIEVGGKFKGKVVSGIIVSPVGSGRLIIQFNDGEVKAGVTSGKVQREAVIYNVPYITYFKNGDMPSKDG